MKEIKTKIDAITNKIEAMRAEVFETVHALGFDWTAESKDPEENYIGGQIRGILSALDELGEFIEHGEEFDWGGQFKKEASWYKK